MKLSVSNIAWKKGDDQMLYHYMVEHNFSGLELAPTRIVERNPYEHIEEAQTWVHSLRREYAFDIPSMQSIWRYREENFFSSDEERAFLILYTQKAVDFAEAIGCKNLVFGCPANRRVGDNRNTKNVALEFFREIGEYAIHHGVYIGLEALPRIYHTDYIMTTQQAIETIKAVDSKGFRLNLDVGTMIYNNESVDIIKDNVELISHVHISEPHLYPIHERAIHRELAECLRDAKYDGYVSIEMAAEYGTDEVIRSMAYIEKVFCID